MSVVIRRGEPQDAATLAEFNRRMALETESKQLDPAVVGRGVARVFDDPAKGFYLVAVQGAEVIGQLMVTFEWSDWRDGWFWWVQSVYVREDARGQGVFRQLFEAVIVEARSTGEVVGVRLYVERENAQALATYQRLGLVDAGYLVRERTLDSSRPKPH